MTIAKRLKTRLSEKQNPIKSGGQLADNCTAVVFLTNAKEKAVHKKVNTFLWPGMSALPESCKIK
ncbi:MAG: hypothetical protein KJ556_03535 [Gammaproteobacteria bacterium]|nr:hypothetical protein [Gammaproteobacteria bacterium]MBU2056558.1 hypothetical protein [Gammaproteobacteria bacterium]MBU2174179.1 hypothetical protein [Gammaproteobacteria bacterium]MBU2248770.1 hypothetical protein [Gammaproteobacteria bacterium]MBU2344050.1 hypothetical protein [Gammaproteobacteria bacterium]